MYERVSETAGVRHPAIGVTVHRVSAVSFFHSSVTPGEVLPSSFLRRWGGTATRRSSVCRSGVSNGPSKRLLYSPPARPPRTLRSLCRLALLLALFLSLLMSLNVLHLCFMIMSIPLFSSLFLHFLLPSPTPFSLFSPNLLFSCLDFLSITSSIFLHYLSHFITLKLSIHLVFDKDQILNSVKSRILISFPRHFSTVLTCPSLLVFLSH